MICDREPARCFFDNIASWDRRTVCFLKEDIWVSINVVYNDFIRSKPSSEDILSGSARSASTVELTSVKYRSRSAAGREGYLNVADRRRCNQKGRNIEMADTVSITTEL